NGEEEAAKPETTWSAAFNPKDMPRAKAAGKVSMLPGMIKVIVRITTAGFMADPFVVGVDVGCVRVIGHVMEGAVLRGRARSRVHRWRAMLGDVSVVCFVAIVGASVPFLCHGDERNDSQ